MRKTTTALLFAALGVYLTFAEVPFGQHKSQSLGQCAAASELGAARVNEYSAIGDAQSETVRGVRIISWNATHHTKRVQVVCLPGLGLCAQGYAPLATELRNLGISTHVIDAGALGHTAGAKDQNKVSLKRTVKDVFAVLETIRNRTPNSRIVVLGESVGAVFALLLASESPQQIDGIICAAPAWKIYKMPSTVLKGLVHPFESAKPGWAARGIIRQVTLNPELRRHLSNDPAHVVDFSIPEALRVTRLMATAPRYATHVRNTPVLFVQGMQDSLVKPNASAALFRKIPSSNKTFMLDLQAEHLVFEEGQFNKQLLLAAAQWIERIQDTEQSPGFPVGIMVASHNYGAGMQEAKKLFRAAGLPDTNLQAADVEDVVAADYPQWTVTRFIP